MVARVVVFSSLKSAVWINVAHKHSRTQSYKKLYIYLPYLQKEPSFRSWLSLLVLLWLSQGIAPAELCEFSARVACGGFRKSNGMFRIGVWLVFFFIQILVTDQQVNARHKNEQRSRSKRLK